MFANKASDKLKEHLLEVKGDLQGLDFRKITSQNLEKFSSNRWMSWISNTQLQNEYDMPRNFTASIIAQLEQNDPEEKQIYKVCERIP